MVELTGPFCRPGKVLPGSLGAQCLSLEQAARRQQYS